MSKTIEAWHRLVSERNTAGLDDILDDNVVFLSPVVFSPQKGREVTRLYLTAALQVLGSGPFRYTREWVGEQDAVLEFETELGGVHINGVDMINWNREGKITEFKVMLRPLKAVNLIHQLMGRALESRSA